MKQSSRVFWLLYFENFSIIKIILQSDMYSSQSQGLCSERLVADESVAIVTHHKKRKLDQLHSAACGPENYHHNKYKLSSLHHHYEPIVELVPYEPIKYRKHHGTSNAPSNIKASPSSALNQNFIRASTIKLLDTYQRCGQKVKKVSIFKILLNFYLF